MKKYMRDIDKDVLITLKSVQSVDAEREETELITEGVLRKVDGGFQIMYDETEATGFVGSTTVLSCFGNDRASMERIGTAPATLIIEKDKKHHCHYGTPYGELMLGVYTHSINNSITENGGNLYFKYTLDVNSSYVSDNEVYVNVKA